MGICESMSHWRITMASDEIELYVVWKAVVNGKEYSNSVLLEGPEKDIQAISALRENLRLSIEYINKRDIEHGQL